MEKVIGIDLGTTNSCVSVIEGGNPVVIVNSEGRRTTPSIVGFTKDGIKVGDPAKRQMAVNKDTIYSIKRLMGKKYDDLSKDMISKFTYKIVKGKNGLACVDVDGRIYTPQEISAMILQKMKKTAEDYLGCDVKKAIITVPAYFSDEERTATIEAGNIAGLEVLRIINEPTAASLAYGEDKEKEGKIAIFDLGGGTFDISILDIGDGVFEVLSTNGNTMLGGDNFDESLVDYIAEDFKKQHGVDVRKDSMALQRLKESSEKAKIELSSSVSTEINLPYLMPIDGVPKHYVKNLSRSEFEKITDPWIQKLIEPCKKAITDSGIKTSELSQVLLVGGSTRVPKVIETVKNIFGKEPNKSINPDESVAQGASIQGGVLIGEVSDILLLDVVSLSLGIETLGGVMTKMIDANTTIPTSKEQIFSTAVDSQPSVSIIVGTGERALMKDNKILGQFNLDNIPPAPRGIPQISVKFDVDANGILKVSAKDKATGKEQSIRIDNSTSLSKDDIERMKQDAKDNEENDKKEKEKIDALNQADALIFQTEKQIKEFGDKLTDSDKSELNSMVEKLKESHKSESLIDIEKYTKELTEIWNRISTQLYSENQSQKESNNHTDSQEADSDYTDFEEVK